MNRRLRHLLLVLLLVGVGLGSAVWYGPKTLGEARATEGWPAVTGTIETAEIVKLSGRSNNKYEVRLAYTYSVGGETYHGTRYAVTGARRAEDQAEAELFARSYRPGDEVAVYHDPADPSQAVLATGGARKAWAVIAFGALLVVAGIVVAVRRLW